MSSIAAFPEALVPCTPRQEVCWLEQREAEVPAGDDWLSTQEAACLARLRFAKRRSDWRLGRWTAKQALVASLNLSSDPRPLAAIEIRATSSGSPEVFISGHRAPVAISLSHSSGLAICALSTSKTTAGETSLGCDVEVVEPHSNAFVLDYFTAGEQALVEQTPIEQRSLLTTVLWSAKESALKALREGLRLDTRSVEVNVGVGPSFQQRQCKNSPLSFPSGIRSDETWYPLQVRYESTQTFHGWWRHSGQFVRTIVSRPRFHVAEIEIS